MSFIKAVDVSSYQYNIDWKKVKAAGIDYAILRIATKTSVDSEFEEYRKGEGKERVIKAADLYYELATNCYSNNPDKSKEYLKTALEIIEPLIEKNFVI